MEEDLKGVDDVGGCGGRAQRLQDPGQRQGCDESGGQGRGKAGNCLTEPTLAWMGLPGWGRLDGAVWIAPSWRGGSGAARAAGAGRDGGRPKQEAGRAAAPEAGAPTGRGRQARPQLRAAPETMPRGGRRG